MLVPRFKPAHAAGLIAVFVACTGALLSAAPLSAQAQSSNTTAAATATPMSKAQPQGTVAFDIAAQDLATALTEFARQSGQELIYNPESASGKTGNAVEGEMSRADAMQQLLQGTGLEFLIMPSGGMMLGNPDEVQSYRAKLQSSSAEAAADASTEVAQAAPAESPLDPTLTDPGTAAPGEQTTSKVEVSRTGGIEEIIVTGQKKEERIQDVPIAISAFSMEDLDNQKIEGGFDLLKAIPNVTFSKSNFTGYNLQIRGIGTQAISATTDPGVAVSFNNTTLIVNRLFEQEYLDIERVEVLRGPQGTLYGRNATAGVVNVISAKPQMGVEEGEAKIEIGNYNAKRLRGHYNIPLGDEFALRAAYAMTQRDGYGFNEASRAELEFRDTQPAADVDNRDLWTGRLTLGWGPSEKVRVNLLWERFEEDDQRVRTAKQLCHRDAGYFGDGNVFQAAASQGCNPRDPVTGEVRSLYDSSAYGTVNGASLPYVLGPIFAQVAGAAIGAIGLGPSPYFGPFATRTPQCAAQNQKILLPANPCFPDPYGGFDQSRDLRSIYSEIDPIYFAGSDVFEISLDYHPADDLTFSSQTVYAEDDYYASQDYNRFAALPIWEDSASACGDILAGQIPIACDQPGTYFGGFYNITPGGVFTDPQLGASRSLVAQDLSMARSTQFNQEFRLVSSYDGAVNFSLGANITRFETQNDYFVFANGLSLLAQIFPFSGPTLPGPNPGIPGSAFPAECPLITGEPFRCVYIDPTSIKGIIAGQGGDGHNYFRSSNPYSLNSSAVFGELYWQATDTVKVTMGARFTWDEKTFTPIPSQLLLVDYRFNPSVPEGAGPESCVNPLSCTLAGTGVNSDPREGARGSTPLPDIVQEWREPTGRLVIDWKPEIESSWLDETLLYASLARGYKGGGANPPNIGFPAGIFNSINSGGTNAPTFKPEYVNALEIGAKNKLFNGGLIVNANAFYYDYKDYQVSKIVDRSAANENFDATIWGLELETILAPTPDLLFNASIGYLRTRIADGEESLDLMDRTQGGNQTFVLPEGSFVRLPNPDYDPATDPLDAATIDHTSFDSWEVIKSFVVFSSNCVVPTAILDAMEDANQLGTLLNLCPGGGLQGYTFRPDGALTLPGGGKWDPTTQAPNGGAGFFADLSGNELPNAPRFTVSLGGQNTFYLPRDWSFTTRVDLYWQDQSFARVYNTEYDRLKAWTNTNFSFWLDHQPMGLRIEAYIKNAFDETPITGAFLNSDDSGLTTNVFTLDPRLFGLSITKRF